ncbi:MAG: HK97 family phage prohead protease, partial [Candidatus Peribacteraceae bacterium]|nr:HK97 family phage prohead protease [Candidatus Peribacteraceae bacterium]
MEMRRTLVPIKVKELGDRVLEIAGSTEDVDRMDDVIKSKGWQLGPFKKNPVFMWGHNYNQPPIGKALKVWVDKETKRLMFNIEFADAETYEFADTIFKLYKGGFLHATSVGFIPLDWEGKDEDNPYPKWEGNVFTKQELLELSAVPVPANANALVTARDNGLITVKEFEAVTKPEETDDYIRIPVKGEEGKHKDHEIKTIDVDKGKGIKALYCVDDKVIITYLFDKDNDEKWTLASAQEWVDEHANKEVPEPREVTQEQIRDDLDYLDKSITAVGLSEETATDAV